MQDPDRPRQSAYQVMWSQGEVNLLIGIATARGLWPPPEDWLPADEERRALFVRRS